MAKKTNKKPDPKKASGASTAQPTFDVNATIPMQGALVVQQPPGGVGMMVPGFTSSSNINTTNDDIATLIIEEMEAQLDVTLDQRKEKLSAAQKQFAETFDPKQEAALDEIGRAASETLKAATAKLRLAFQDLDPAAEVRFLQEERFSNPPKANQEKAFYANVASHHTNFGEWWTSYGKTPLRASLSLTTKGQNYNTGGTVDLAMVVQPPTDWTGTFAEHKKAKKNLTALEDAVAAVHREKAKSAARQRTVRANIARASLERTDEGRQVYEALKHRSMEALVRLGFAPAIDLEATVVKDD
jgi:hypothetical protein